MLHVSKAIASKRIAIMCVLLTLFCITHGYAQKYVFTHYDIEDGLVQSTVNRLTEDKNHRLWIATMGGACSWNGKEFAPHTKEHGLNSNFILSFFCDDQYRLWMGTSAGLSVFSNKEAFNYPSPQNLKSHSVTRIVQDKQGQTWVLMSNKLCRVEGKTVKQIAMPSQLSGVITTIATNTSRELFICVDKTGIYKLVNNKWHLVVLYDKAYSKQYFHQLLFDKANPNEFFLMAEGALLKFRNNALLPYEPAFLNSRSGTFSCMQQDKDFNLWIGATSGAYRISKGKLTVFNSSNGFADQVVSDIYNDEANNLWFGLGGSGIYKYEGDDYTTINNLPGKDAGLIVTALAKQTNGNILVGTDNAGILQYDGKVLKPFWRGVDSTMANFVTCMYTDKTGTIWMGANHGGLWKSTGKSFVQIPGTKGKSICSITADDKGNVWTAGPGGCRYIEQGKAYMVKGNNVYSNTVLSLGHDSVLVGGQDGLRLIVKNEIDDKFRIKALNSIIVNSVYKLGNYILVGTGGNGLMLLDIKARKYRWCTVNDGLNSNMVYSITADKYGLVWVGTGRGVNRLMVNPANMSYRILEDNTPKTRIVEASPNAITYYNDKVFVGTSSGISIFNCKGNYAAEGKPFMVFNQLKFDIGRDDRRDNTKLKSRPIDDSNILTLNYKQNQVKMSYLGIYLKNPESVYYQYKMAGLDSNFSQPVQTTEVDYLSLPPGRYTFMVKAGLSKKTITGPELTFSFIIKPPFYQTLTFRIGAVLLLILLGGGLQYYYQRQKHKRLLMLEAVRIQEKIKIRQQTAEDFHDDLGNKLTRISVLSDILDAKVQGQEDQKNLIKQIKQNVDALYKGTKDILWALDPKSDSLFEILLHIKDFGRDLFEDTDIDFVFNDIECELDKIKLPMEYCRNLTMISKEILNNILRHANAKHVKMDMTIIGNNGISITITDDGRGFDSSVAHKGRGLGNINKRVKRINGQLTITSAVNEGTHFLLEFIAPKT